MNFVKIKKPLRQINPSQGLWFFQPAGLLNFLKIQQTGLIGVQVKELIRTRNGADR